MGGAYPGRDLHRGALTTGMDYRTQRAKLEQLQRTHAGSSSGQHERGKFFADRHVSGVVEAGLERDWAIAGLAALQKAWLRVPNCWPWDWARVLSTTASKRSTCIGSTEGCTSWATRL